MNNDLISREALKKMVYAKFGNSNLSDAFNDIIDNAPAISPFKAIHDELHKEEEECMDEDAKQASIPYTYNAPQHDWKCGYPDITRGKGGVK